jgi:hypothetical protein
MKQKEYLWNLGLRDQAIIDSLGKRQASALIDQLKAKDSGNGCLVLVLVTFAILIIAFFASA